MASQLDRPTQELHIDAGPEGLATARTCAADAAAAFGLDELARCDVVLAVNEAVTNALFHGVPDEHGRVRLEANVGHERLTFSVHDNGRFRRPAIATPEDDHGRGLKIIGEVMDEVLLTIGPAGTTVQFSRLRR